MWLCLWLPTAASAAPAKKLSPHRLEWGAIGGPAVNVDTGLELAGFVHLAQFHPSYRPYRWRLRASFKIAIRPLPQSVEFPVHDYNIRLDQPGLFGGRLRLQTRGGFRRMIAPYFGLGNGASGTRHWLKYDPEGQRDLYIRALRRYQYRRLAPYVEAAARWRWAPGFELFGDVGWEYSSLKTFAKSKLEEDARASRQDPKDPRRQLLHGLRDHALLRLQVGIVWDTRDNEFAPSRGMFHDVSVRGNPLWVPFAFAGLNATARFYFPLWRDILVLALRAVGDLLVGDVPVYLLTAVGGLSPQDSFGGGNTLRGVRAGRYHGKAKLFGNLELRFRAVGFVVAGTYFAVDLVAFFDAGRTWLEWLGALERFAPFDGPDPGLHFGVGGGLRVRWGKSLVIRFDLAYSPDANPIGFYFNLGHLF